MVVNVLYFKSSLPYDPDQIVGMVHLAVTIGNGRKIKADLCKAESSRLVFLTIPQRLHDVQAILLIHDIRRPPEYTQDFPFTES